MSAVEAARHGDARHSGRVSVLWAGPGGVEPVLTWRRVSQGVTQGSATLSRARTRRLWAGRFFPVHVGVFP